MIKKILAMTCILLTLKPFMTWAEVRQCIKANDDMGITTAKINGIKKSNTKNKFSPSISLQEDIFLKAVERSNGEVIHEELNTQVSDSSAPCSVNISLRYVGNSTHSLRLKKGFKIQPVDLNVEYYFSRFNTTGAYFSLKDKNKNILIIFRTGDDQNEKCKVDNVQRMINEKTIYKLDFISPLNTKECKDEDSVEEISTRESNLDSQKGV